MDPPAPLLLRMDPLPPLDVLRTLATVLTVAMDRVDAERQNPAHKGTPTLDIYAGIVFAGMAQALAGTRQDAEALVAQLRTAPDA